MYTEKQKFTVTLENGFNINTFPGEDIDFIRTVHQPINVPMLFT